MERKKNFKCLRTSSTKLHIRIFHLFDVAKTVGKYTEGKNARPKRAKLLFLFVKYANLWCRHHQSEPLTVRLRGLNSKIAGSSVCDSRWKGPKNNGNNSTNNATKTTLKWKEHDVSFLLISSRCRFKASLSMCQCWASRRSVYLSADISLVSTGPTWLAITWWDQYYRVREYRKQISQG